MTASLWSSRVMLSGDVLRRGPAIAIIYVTLAVVILYPVVIIFTEPFSGTDISLTTSFIRVFSDSEVIRALGNTFLISLVSVIIAAFIGVALAWLVARTDMPGKGFFDPLNMIPFYLSSIVGALSWQVILAPRTGLLNVFLSDILGPQAILNIYSVGGISFVLGLFYAPYIYLFTLGSLQSMDPSLEEAARMSGASVLRTAFRVTLPLSAPAIFSASLLVFVTCAGIFGVPLVLGAPGRVDTLSTLIFRAVGDYPADYGEAAVLSLALFAFTASLIALQLYLLRGKAFITVTGKAYRPGLLKLGGWRWAGFALNSVYLLLVLAPLLALLLVSLQNTWTGVFEWGRMTLENYRKVLFLEDVARRGLFNSLFISVIGATIAVAFCGLLALILHRTRLPMRRGIAFLAMVPVALPGIVLGVAFLMAFISTPLYGTIWLIMIAYIVHYLPTGVRNMESLVQAVSRELDESARMSGANWRQAMMRIVIPLIAPGMVSTWILLFVTFIREVSASMILYTYGTETMTMALIQIMEYEPYGVSGAFGILQTVLLLLCVVLIRWLAKLDFSRSRLSAV